MIPGAAERGEQLHRIGGLQVEQGVGQRAEISQAEQPAGVHREAAFECVAALHLPAVEQQQQPDQQRRHDHQSADQAMREAAVHRQRRPANPAEEYIDIGHVGAKHERGEALAGLGLEARLTKRPAGEGVG